MTEPVPFDAAALLGEIRAWVEVESPTTDAAAVDRAMDLAAADAQAAGARVTRIPGRDGFGAHMLVASPWGGEAAPGILMLSHLDTVHPHGTLAGELPFRVEGDSAFGPGIYDMKGGALLALAALRGLIGADAATILPVRQLFVSDEEVGSPTSREVIEREAGRARHVLVTEPAREGGRIVIARKGTARFDLRVTGRAAHSGTAHAAGRSAVRELARQILALEDMTDHATGVTVNVGRIGGGTGTNVVPAEAWAAIDMRVPDQALGEAAITRVLALRPHDPHTRLSVTGGLNRPAYAESAAGAALFARARAVAAGIGIALEGVSTGGGSDGNFTAALGVPTLDGLGVDGRGAHTHEEQLYVSSLVPRARLLQGLMRVLD